jgi:hypothetical protein
MPGSLRRWPGILGQHWQRGGAKAALLIGAFLGTYYGNVLFLGKSLVYTDNYNPLNPAFTKANYGPRMVEAGVWHRRNMLVYPNFRDPGATWWQWEPGGEFLREALRDGEMPYWNPHVGGGAPAMANLTMAYFFPPYLLLVLAGNTVLLKNFYFLALQAVSAWLVYLLLRRHGYGWQGSTFAALVWIASGGMAQNVGSFIGQTASCIPVALYLTSRFVERPTLRWTGGLALAYAALALASFPPVLVIVFGLSALYVMIAILRPAPSDGEPPSRFEISSRYAIAVALSLGLVAWYYAPAALAARAATHAMEFYRDEGLLAFPIRSLYQLLSPVLMGGVHIYQQQFIPGSEHFYFPYVGVVALCVAGFARRRDRGDLLFLTALVGGALMVLKILGAAPVHWVAYLPILNTVHFAHYMGIGVCLALAVLAGIGLDSLLRLGGTRPRWVLLTLVFLLAACTLFEIGWKAGAIAPPQINRWLFEWCLLVTLGTSFLALAFIAGRPGASPRRRQTFLIGAFLLLGLEGAHNTIYPRQSRWDVWHHPPAYIRALADRGPLERIFTTGAPYPNTNGPFEISTFDSLMTFNSPRAFELYRRYWQPEAFLFLRQAVLLPPDGVLDAAGIGTLAIREAHPALMEEAVGRGYESFFRDEYIQLFERQAPERCIFTSDYRVAERSEVLELLPHRSMREILLESPPPSGEPAPNRENDPVPVVSELRRNRYAVELHAPRPGFLYCADSHFPGWTAHVDDRPQPILLANYAFRAVSVPRGHHRVEFSYEPPGLRAGGWAALMAALGSLALCCFRGRRPRVAFAPPAASRTLPHGDDDE